MVSLVRRIGLKPILWCRRMSTLDYTDVRKIVDSKKDDTIVVDVRRPDELLVTELLSALQLPNEEFKEKYGFAKPTSQTQLVFSCQKGIRAENATKLAIELGYNAKCYRGSWDDWSKSNVLLSFPPSIRKILITEVVNFLYQNSNIVGMNGITSSTASTPTALMTSIAAATSTGVPYTISSMTPTESGLASLSTLFHVRWVMEIMAQAFNLPLEDINIISDAASIYIQWLIEPSKRPPAILKADFEVQQQFIQTMLRHISLLFQPKKVDGVGAAKPLLATLASKHVEVCKLMLRTLVQIAVSPNNEIPADRTITLSNATWKVLLRILLGVTDYLLRMPVQPYCYLCEELGEILLSIFMELWLRSEIFSAELWRTLKVCYPTWTHRMLAISQWSAVSLALTQRITKILYGQGTQSVVYTVHSNLVTLDLSDQYAVYAWYQIVHLIGNPSQLAPSLFFRSVLGMEKLVQVFHSIGYIKGNENAAVERHFPDGNTMLHLFGSWLFEAVSRNSHDCSEGRAQAFGVLCRIFVRPQLRASFLATYLHQFYAAIIDGLKGDLMSLVFIVVNCEDIFALGLPGIRILVAPFVYALRRIIPELEKPLRVSLNLDDLRRACYKLLCTMFGCCGHFSDAAIHTITTNDGEFDDHIATISPTMVNDDNRKVPQSNSSQNVTDVQNFIDQVRALYKPFLGSLSLTQGTLSHVRYWIMELLIRSFCNEKDPGNQRYLINSLTAFTIDDAKNVPGLTALVVSLFEEHLASGRWSVDVCLVATEALRQFVPYESQISAARPDALHHLTISLCGLVSSFMGRNNLPQFLKPILALFECILDWIIGASSGSSWFSHDSDCQLAFIQILVKSLAYGALNQKKADGTEASIPISKKSTGSINSPHSPAFSPSISMSLTLPGKSLEAQLAVAAEITLSRLMHYYALSISSAFYPNQMSALANEVLLLNSNDKTLNYVAGQPKRLSALNRDQIHALRYFILNGNTIACFVEKPIEVGLTPSHSIELVALLRTIGGRFAWENSLVYALKSTPMQNLDIGEDPQEVETISASKNFFAYANVFADSYKEQLALAESHEEVKTLPIQLDTVGPVYNDAISRSRFTQDDKRVLNYNCIDNLAKQQVNRTYSSIVTSCNAIRNYRARPEPVIAPETQLARLMLSQCGLTSLRCREAVMRLPNCIELLADLEILDSLSERETISCSIFFVRSGRQSLSEILLERCVSNDFVNFIHSVGWPADIEKHSGWMGSFSPEFASSIPYFASSSVEVVYHVPHLMNMSSIGNSSNQSPTPVIDGLPPHIAGLFRLLSNDLVCILWIEDLQEMLTLPSKFQTRAIVYICVSPLPDPMSSGLYRIRIMVTSLATAMISSSPQSSFPVGDAVFLFGPLLDGMIIQRESLGKLVRDTAISASLFCLYNIQNQPRPMAKRAQFIQHMVNKYRMMAPTPGKYYNELIYNAGP